MVNCYRIAGLVIKMDTFGRTEQQALPYVCENTENYDFEVTAVTRERYIQEYPQTSLDVAEYMCTGGNFFKKLLDYGGMMLHSSAVVVDGRAYLFTADSGTGKSTHTGLWLKKFGERAYILNDDKPALRLEDGVWYAYGTPWSGKHDISVNTRVPVAGIAVVHRGETNTIESFKGIAAIHAILKQINKVKAPEYRGKQLELLDKLITQVPIWKLTCNMDPEAAEVSYAAMSGEKEN